MNSTSRGALGFTLIELLVVISILGILLAFLAPIVVGRITTNARRTATQQEMRMLRDAIAGNPDVTVGGEMVSTGFKNDIGRWPRNLVELATKDPFQAPWSAIQYAGKTVLPDWDPYLKKGWNGPYIREDGNMSYLHDKWGTDYRFYVEGSDTAGLWSAGPNQLFLDQAGGGLDSDDIIVRF